MDCPEGSGHSAVAALCCCTIAQAEGSTFRDADVVSARETSRRASVASARSLLRSLTGQEISTVTGRPNRILRLDGDDVIVATERSPAGTAVPIQMVQFGLDRLQEAGELEISVASLGHRSSFVGAVLLCLPGTHLSRTSPPCVLLADPATQYKLSQAGSINAWWSADPRQRFWLEITDRHDIGVDLHCPQRSSDGKRSSGFSLIWWVSPGDIVFQYSLAEDGIMSWSRAAGPVTAAPTIWRPHRSATRRRIQHSVPQPGWWLDLDGPFPLPQPLTGTELTRRQEEIRAVLRELEGRHQGSLYFPFFWWADRQLRPMQYYLNKLPAELVDIFPELVQALEPPPGPSESQPQPVFLGTDYRPAQVGAAAGARQPFTTDPAIVERGLRGHADTQNELARVLRDAGLSPRSRLPHEPNFDLAWQAGDTAFVAEIKSITDDNEEEQLRLGLGQVLRYRHRLQRIGYLKVIAVLVPERPPRDLSWAELCHSLQVVLLHGDNLDQAAQLSRDDLAART